MSIKIYASSIKIGVNYSRQRVVAIERETLSDFVRRVIKEKDLNYREVARRAGVSHGKIGDVINKPEQDVGIGTLKAIAKGLGVPEDLLFEIAREMPAESGDQYKQSVFYELYQKLDQLDEYTKDHVITSVTRLNRWADERLLGSAQDQVSQRRKRS
jgi:transcriptional regulator with XRE-family HTH domain